MMKTCGMCKNEFPKTLEYFHKKGKYLRSYCKSCSIKVNSEWQKINKEKVNASSKAWRDKNPEKRNAIKKAWALANPEKVKHIWRKAASKHKALLLGNDHSPYTETEMLKRYGTVCYLCNEQIDFDAPRTGAGYEKSFWRDHVVALINGGPDTLDNVKPSHAVCNQLKGTKEIYEIQMA